MFVTTQVGFYFILKESLNFLFDLLAGPDTVMYYEEKTPCKALESKETIS